MSQGSISARAATGGSSPEPAGIWGKLATEAEGRQPLPEPEPVRSVAAVVVGMEKVVSLSMLSAVRRGIGPTALVIVVDATVCA